MTLQNGTFEQLATKSAALLKPYFYAPISSLENSTMLTNNWNTVFEANFWRTTWKITWKFFQVKSVKCSCACTNQWLSWMLFFAWNLKWFKYWWKWLDLIIFSKFKPLNGIHHYFHPLSNPKWGLRWLIRLGWWTLPTGLRQCSGRNKICRYRNLNLLEMILKVLEGLFERGFL